MNLEGFANWLDASAEWIIGVVILIGLAQNLVALIQLVVASATLRKADSHDTKEALWQRAAPGSTPIALIAPAYNEAHTIVDSLKSLLGLHYPYFEVIVVNDGSKDETLEKLREHFELTPAAHAYEEVAPHKPIHQIYRSGNFKNLIVIDKVNGGKADSLNAGINIARSPIFCAVDADSLLDTEALLMAAGPFRENPREVIAVGGVIRIANGCSIKGGRVRKVALPGKLLPLIQVVEYTRAFLIARVAMSRLGILTLISGAFGVFNRRAALAVGGYARDTVGEDYELILRLHRYHIEHQLPYQIRTVPEPVCWTEAPDNLKTLANQRKRWQRGALEAFFRHKKMLFNPAYGKLGIIGMGFSLLVDVLGPLAEVLGYILVPVFWFSGVLDTSYALAFLALIFSFGVFVSAGSMVLEEASLYRIPSAKDLLKITAVILVENFGYRQLCNIWRIQGWWQFLRKKQGWGEMARTGFRQS